MLREGFECSSTERIWRDDLAEPEAPRKQPKSVPVKCARKAQFKTIKTEGTKASKRPAKAVCSMARPAAPKARRKQLLEAPVVLPNVVADRFAQPSEDAAWPLLVRYCDC